MGLKITNVHVSILIIPILRRFRHCSKSKNQLLCFFRDPEVSNNKAAGVIGFPRSGSEG